MAKLILGFVVIVGCTMLLLALIAPSSSSSQAKAEEHPEKVTSGISPCVQKLDQLVDLARLSGDADKSGYVYRSIALIQQGQNIVLQPGTHVRVEMELSEATMISPLDGQHAGASSCLVPSAILRPSD